MEFSPHKVLSNTVDTLEGISLSLSPQPKHEAPDFPDEISALAPLELSNLLIMYTSWFAYTAGVEAYYAAQTNLLKGQLDYVAARCYLTSEAKTIEDRKISKYNDEEYVKLNQQYLEADAKHEITRSITQKFDKYIWAISRVMTTLSVEESRGKY